MELKEYYKNSLFYQAMMNPLEGTMVDKTGMTEGIETHTVLREEDFKENGFELCVRGRANQYFTGRNLTPDQSIVDRFEYEVLVYFLENRYLVVDVDSSVERQNGLKSFWKGKTLPTANEFFIWEQSGISPLIIHEYYSLVSGILVHEKDKDSLVELYEVPDGFKLGDSFQESPKHIARYPLTNEIMKIKKLQSQNRVNQK